MIKKKKRETGKAMDKKELEKRIDELYELLMKPETKEDWKKLLADLCTYTEIEQMARRAYAAKLFLEGNTYNSIIAETELSSATLSRVSRCLSHGSGGYAEFIGKDGRKERK